MRAQFKAMDGQSDMISWAYNNSKVLPPVSVPSPSPSPTISGRRDSRGGSGGRQHEFGEGDDRQAGVPRIWGLQREGAWHHPHR